MIHAPINTSSSKSWRPEDLWHDGDKYAIAMGCHRCPDFLTCGGLSTRSPLLDCLELCCGQPASCQLPCRLSFRFRDRMREIQGFSLTNLGPTAPIAAPALPTVVPMIYHGNRRQTVFAAPVVALKLYNLINFRTGGLRFTTRTALCDAFKIAPTATILLTGIEQDEWVERWWGLGLHCRRDLIAALRAIGIGMVTTPNFSVCLHWPRQVDMSSMKRILHTYTEFMEGGIPTALHLNGRTPRDFDRWAECITSRPEVTHVACEFTTGSGTVKRKPLHVAWLAELARKVGRPLHLIIAGDRTVLQPLAAVFARITVLETTSFMKALHRQRAVLVGNSRLTWETAATARSAPVDHLLEHNYSLREPFLRMHAGVPVPTHT